jgi:hypothetical protein
MTRKESLVREIRAIRAGTLDQSVSFNGNRVLPIMTAAALTVVARGLGHDQCHFEGVAQADQAIA